MNMRSNCPARRRQARGFSLIELLIVIAIILTIAAIAVPRLLRSRMVANETSAAASLRTLCTVQITYESTYKVGYAPSLAALGPPAGGTPPSATSAGLIDVVLAGGTKSGYVFTYSPVDTNGDGQMDTFTITAAPFIPGQTGDRYFFVDLSNVIRYNVGAAATATSTPIPQ
ncbi:MAG: prepilin-type N-terminal cleavage/methylation domain-containing protein [Acidobacteria bacterium]|nr:prepilin-type N-terminal cleavage/methylation domain-containing protein [Acidobacteriota bacterium]